ncbi:MAG: translation initiation factor IF-2 N-terminal domain-containing protein, partial [Thermoleophilaceae bacterium]|nr:translation initiation factor IF-2 N-terminal domain-containing protein [Thermoleophilaceae bacterium]
MAKKRVHQIAKERGISSKEVLVILQAAGLDVKVAASSVDESEAAAAFSNGGAAPAAEESEKKAPGGKAAKAKTAVEAEPKDEPSADPDSADTPEQPARPKRTRPGEQPAGAGPSGGRRRVVIDSQAARRGSG